MFTENVVTVKNTFLFKNDKEHEIVFALKN